MRVASWIAVALVLVAVSSSASTIFFEENRGQAGLVVPMVTDSYVDISFKLDQMSIDDVDVDGTLFQQISIPGVMLPNDEGAPNLPGFGRFIAVPNGAVPRLEIVSMESQIFHGIDVLPAADIPLETDDSPPVYVKDEAIYSVDANFPEHPVKISELTSLRGVDTVVLGITPFQYNPVTRELIAYTSVEVRVNFEGGSGTFGEDRLRNRYWEPVLAGNLVNYESLPDVQFGAPNTRDTDYEYVVIVPDDPTYIAWGDTLARFRLNQGIDAGVVTLTETHRCRRRDAHRDGRDRRLDRDLDQQRLRRTHSSGRHSPPRRLRHERRYDGYHVAHLRQLLRFRQHLRRHRW